MATFAESVPAATLQKNSMEYLQISLLAFATVLLATVAACRGEDLPGPRREPAS